jgi:hypothetical protein
VRAISLRSARPPWRTQPKLCLVGAEAHWGENKFWNHSETFPLVTIWSACNSCFCTQGQGGFQESGCWLCLCKWRGMTVGAWSKYWVGLTKPPRNVWCRASPQWELVVLKPWFCLTNSEST